MLLIDDYTRMTFVFLLNNKSEAFRHFKHFKEQIENESDMKIKCLRSDNGGEFTSNEFNDYCSEQGIKRKFSAARTPQQNGVAEIKNRKVMEMARTMLNEAGISDRFWPQEVHTAVYIINRALLRNNTDKTPYKLWKGRPGNIKHFRVFGSKCYIRREDRIGKFDSRVDERILLGYSSRSKAYKCYNLRLNKIVESINVKIDDYPSEQENTRKEINGEDDSAETKLQFEEYSPSEEQLERVPQSPSNNNQAPSKVWHQSPSITIQTPSKVFQPSLKTPTRYVQKNHPAEQIIGDEGAGVETRSRKQLQSPEQWHVSLLSTIEPKNFDQASQDKSWTKEMEEEINQIEKNYTWELVDRPKNNNVIGTKWVFRNKLNEDGQVTRNKTRLVCKGYAHVEGIDFEETFYPVARMESIRMILAYASSKNIKVYQMDVK